MPSPSQRFADWILLGPDANVRMEGTLSLVLPSGRKVDVRRQLLGFEKWKGKKPDLPRIWSSKGYLDHKGEPLFAELMILRALQRDRWEGVWVNNFSRTFQKGLPKLSPECDLHKRCARCSSVSRNETEVVADVGTFSLGGDKTSYLLRQSD